MDSQSPATAQKPTKPKLTQERAQRQQKRQARMVRQAAKKTKQEARSAQRKQRQEERLARQESQRRFQQQWKSAGPEYRQELKVTYAEQLDQLRDQGFENERLNLRLLAKNQGDLDATAHNIHLFMTRQQQRKEHGLPPHGHHPRARPAISINMQE